MRKAFLSDEQWAKIEPLLPKSRSRGRPWIENRRVLEGILWVLTQILFCRNGRRKHNGSFADYETCRRKLIIKNSRIICAESNEFFRVTAEKKNIKPTISRTTKNYD